MQRDKAGNESLTSIADKILLSNILVQGFKVQPLLALHVYFLGLLVPCVVDLSFPFVRRVSARAHAVSSVGGPKAGAVYTMSWGRQGRGSGGRREGAAVNVGVDGIGGGDDRRG